MISMRAACACVLWSLLLACLTACGQVGTQVLSQPDTSAVTPSITVQPADQSIKVGDAATFSVVAAGSVPLFYQWHKNGAAIAGATAADYTTPAVIPDNDGDAFGVIISNSAGATASSNARLSVTASAIAPAITSEPSDASMTVGQTATFSVVASGTAPLSYQWQKNGTAIAGATSASYSTTAATTADNGASFAVVVSNSVGSATSRSAKLTVAAPGGPVAPSITVQPADQSIRAGQTATYSVTAAGTAPLSYQWQKNGTAIAGATSASYTTPAATTADNGATFAVVVSNSAGSATSRSARLTVGPAATSGTDVVTYKNDLARTGQNLTETVLTLANVNATSFGKLRFLSADAKVDAQPLYVSALTVQGATHNVVFVATENDSVYAFDADSGATLWHWSLPPGEVPSLTHTTDCDQIVPMIGITSTPVIDRAAGLHGTIYFVTMSNSSGTDHQRLHALDLATGAELLGGPKEITASYPAPAGGGTRTFAAGQYAERAALLLSHGVIYTSWTSHCDIAPYTGWVIGFSQTTLAQTGVLNVAPNGTGTGVATAGPAIWMSGGGPAADAAGNVYLLTGNGAFEVSLDAGGFPIKGDYGNSFLKLSSALAVADYFTMSNEVAESLADQDLGSGGAMLLPDLTDSTATVRHLAVGAGKDGNIYVVNRDAMGKFTPPPSNNPQIWQQLTHVLGDGTGDVGNAGGGIWSTPAYFNGMVYYGPQGKTLRAFALSNARLASSPGSQTSGTFVYPGAAPAVSANGSSDGIVWAHENTNPAVLHAYDASNLAHELYNSSQAAAGRDQFGAGNKFITPTVADGKVFVGTTNGVAVFGLLP
jgi:hypothetical protein